MEEKNHQHFVIGVDKSNGVDPTVLSVALVVNCGRKNAKSIILMQKTINELVDYFAETYISTTKQFNPKITHLAYHSKKARVRKKNQARLCRIAFKLAGISSKGA